MRINELQKHVMSFLEDRGFSPEHVRELSEDHDSVTDPNIIHKSTRTDLASRCVLSEMRLRHIHLQNSNRSRARAYNRLTVYVSGLFEGSDGKSKLCHQVIEITVPEEIASERALEKGTSVHSLMGDLHNYLDTRKGSVFKYQMVTYSGPLVGIRAIVA